MSEIAAIADYLSSNRETPTVLATLVGIEGSSYRRPGARLLLRADGTHLGSISGGCLEEDLKEHARRVLTTGQPKIVVYDTTMENDLVWGVGLGCQGVVRVFLERLAVPAPRWVAVLRANLAARRETALVVEHGGAAPRGTRLAEELEVTRATAGERSGAAGDSAAVTQPAGCFCETIAAPPALVVFGAGDDAQPLARFAKILGWHLTVADSRAAHATTERFPEAAAVCVAPAMELAARVGLDGSTSAVVMTHRYRDDLALLRTLLPGPVRYLGLLGPRKRTARLLAELAGEGFATDAAALARLHAPVGLDLGGTTAETVALAIVSEIQARLAGRSGGCLRERTGAIHG